MPWSTSSKVCARRRPRPSPRAPIHRLRWLFAGVVIAGVLGAAGFATLKLTKASTQDRDPTGEVKRYEIFRDDGDTRLRVWIPEVMPAGRTHRLRSDTVDRLVRLRPRRSQ